MVIHMPEVQTWITTNAHHVAVMSKLLFIGAVIMTNVTETKVGNYCNEYFTVCVPAVSRLCYIGVHLQ